MPSRPTFANFITIENVPMSRPPRITLRVVADACQCSTATVSLALRDSPEIPAATRAKVRRVAKKLGYEANRSMARVMSEIRSPDRPAYKETLAYLIEVDKTRREPWHRRMRAGVERRAAELGYKIDVWEFARDEVAPRQMTRVLRSRGIRGVIVGPFPRGKAELLLDWSHFAPVAIGYSMAKPVLHRVARDLFQEFRRAIARFEIAGYRRLGWVAMRVQDESMAGVATAAYLLAMNDHRTLLPTSPLIVEEFDRATLCEWVERERPDIVVSMENRVGDWLNGAPRAGPRVDFFSGNCDDTKDPHSGLYGNFETIGAAAVEQVSALIEHGGFGVPREPTTLLVPGIWNRGKTVRATFFKDFPSGKRPPRRTVI